MSRSWNDGRDGPNKFQSKPKNPKKGKDNRSNEKQHLKDLPSDVNDEYYEELAEDLEKRNYN
jgi:hypothetical protein